MAVERVLFVNLGIEPYMDESHESLIGKHLPIKMQEKGIDTRVFMPKYGLVNERKNLLHEVIRLSGQNIIINKNDHPLVIKVSSMPTLRMQTYFIHNEHFFGRKHYLTDKGGKHFMDNDERAIFYARGVMETVKNLSWSPDVIHCHGWISSLVPIFLKKLYALNPLFADAKVVFSVYNDHAPVGVSRTFANKLTKSGIPSEDADRYKQSNYEDTLRLAIDYSDGVIISHKEVSKSVRDHITESKKPFIEHHGKNYADSYLELYHRITSK